MRLSRFAVFLLFFCVTAQAKIFRNAYVSFELPPNWNCKLEGSEWVCENEFATRTKEAIIILTAKEVGPTDTLAGYLAHLQTPRLIPGKGGVPTRSQVISVKQRMIGGNMWIDGLHLGSEVGSYFTRYLATIKDKIAILITFSAHKEHYTKYSADFIKAIESLKVVASKDTLGRAGMGANGMHSSETIGAPIGQNIPSFDNSALPPENNSSGSLRGNLLLLAILLGAVGAFFYVKYKNPKSKKKKKK